MQGEEEFFINQLPRRKISSPHKKKRLTCKPNVPPQTRKGASRHYPKRLVVFYLT